MNSGQFPSLYLPQLLSQLAKLVLVSVLEINIPSISCRGGKWVKLDRVFVRFKFDLLQKLQV